MTLPNKLNYEPRKNSSHSRKTVTSSIYLKPMLSALQMCENAGLCRSPVLHQSSETKGEPMLEQRLSSEFSSLLESENPTVCDRIKKLKSLYEDHLNDINKACDDFCKRNLSILETQSTQRPVTRSQMVKVVAAIHEKFAEVRVQLHRETLSKIISVKRSVGSLRLKKRANLPKGAKIVLRKWMMEHFVNPYPSEEEKTLLAKKAGISFDQVNNWFINARVREWKPMLRENAIRKMTPTFTDNGCNMSGNSSMRNFSTAV